MAEIANGPAPRVMSINRTRRSTNPLDDFSVEPSEITFLGRNLRRPECILAEPDGSLWIADARGGVLHLRPDGSQRLVTQKGGDETLTNEFDASSLTEGTLPNGLAFGRRGEIYVANFGTDRLEVMTRNGHTTVLADKIDGLPIGKVNFVLRDSRDRLWLTISTRIRNWMEALRPDICDGYIALYEHGRLRIVADGLHFPNEIRFDASEEWLYVAETTGPWISRYRVDLHGNLTGREIFGPRQHDALIDGIAFDAYGNLWGTHVMVDRVFAITPEGELRILLDDAPAEPSRKLMEAFHRSAATPELMLACQGTIAPWCASITFGGADLRTVYLGSLRGTRIPLFRSPIPGLPMIHWGEMRK